MPLETSDIRLPSVLATIAGSGTAAGDLFLIWDLDAGLLKSITRSELKIAFGLEGFYKSGNYNVIDTTAASAALLIGAAGLDPTNYYRNSLHEFGSPAGATLYARLNSTGFGVGVTPAASLHSSAADGTKLLGLSGTTMGLRAVTTSVVAQIDGVSADLVTSYQPLFLNGSSVLLGASGTEIARAESGAFRPGADNTSSSGHASYRWSVVYAATGSINTSAREAKRNIFYLSHESLADLRAAQLLRVGRRLARQVSVFQFAAAIEAKGEDAARLHNGWIFDDVVATFEAEGLDPYKFGAICRDPKLITKRREKPTKVQATEEVDDGFDVVVDGDRAKRVKRPKKPSPVFRPVPLFDENDKPVMVPSGRLLNVKDAAGNRIPEMVQATHPEPVMVDGPPEIETYEEEVPGEYVEGLRTAYLDHLCLAALNAALEQLEA